MTDKELRDAAVAALKRTTISYPEWEKRKAAGRYADVRATEWWKAYDYLGRIGVVLEPPPPPPPPPPGKFGANLPPRIARSTGPVINVASEAELLNALSSAAPGSRINITASLIAPMRTINITRNASPSAPITVTCNPGVVIKNYASWNVSGSYLRFQGLEFYCDLPPDPNGAGAGAICPRSGGHHIEIERCISHGAPAGNNSANGFYIGSGCGPYVQIWDSVMHHVGRAVGLDHGTYWSTSPEGSDPHSGLFSCLLYQPFAYGVQLYPNVKGLIVSGCTIDEGSQNENGGGMVVGDEDNSSTRNTTTIGCIVSNAPRASAYKKFHGGPGHRILDSLEHNNALGGWPSSDSKWTVSGCASGDPLYVNRQARDYRLKAGSPAIGLVKPERYGLLPPTYRDGSPRLAGVAGSEPPA